MKKLLNTIYLTAWMIAVVSLLLISLVKDTILNYIHAKRKEVSKKKRQYTPTRYIITTPKVQF